MQTTPESHSHHWSLPKSLSKSGQRPSLAARLGFVIVGLGFSFLIANAAFAAVIEGRIYPGISVAGQDISWATRREAVAKLNGRPNNYKLLVVMGDKTFATDSRTIGADYDLSTTAELAYRIGRSNIALLGLADSNHKGQLGYSYKLDHSKLSKFAEQLVDSVGRPAINATLKVTSGSLQIVPDQAGLTINTSELEKDIATSLIQGSDGSIHLKPEILPATIKASDTKAAYDKASELLQRKITLIYNGKIYSPTADDIGHWLAFVETRQLDGTTTLDTTIDETQVKGYVQAIANQINIAPITKKITVVSGLSSVTTEGVNGLAIDQNAASSAIIKAMNQDQDLNFTISASPVAFTTETNQAGGLNLGHYIEVNLTTQTLWAYQDNQVVYTSPLTSGATGAGFPTATGLFNIYYKTTNTYLNGHPYGYNYNVFVQYWMPFYQGYGLHDASWRSSFGGPDYYYGGSHGCVNLPLATAAFLYSWADVGTPVWVHT